MGSNQTAQQFLWIDPVHSLSAHEHAKLLGAGLVLRSFRSLQEIKDALLEQPTTPLVLLHDKAHDLLGCLSNLFPNAIKTRALICRVDRSQIDLVVDAVRKGACHVIASDDWSLDTWKLAVHSAIGIPNSQEAIDLDEIAAPLRSKTVSMASKALNDLTSSAGKLVEPKSVVYVDPLSQHLLALAQRVAQANVTALIEGPTGAGKEILARVLHESSKRARGPFVGLNCAALPEHLIDDMLFGHEKGAFTGAHKDSKGLFEQANGGTLFLDEIGEMPLHLQSKLLRVLQERQLTRLGADRSVAVDVRIVAATNKDLRKAIAAKEFREDLYFRISTFKLRVPPLRERPGDILPLVGQLLNRHARETQFTLSQSAQHLLLSYSWPGNVRELENVVQRAVVLCPDGNIDRTHLMFDEFTESLDLNLCEVAESFTQRPASAEPVDYLKSSNNASEATGNLVVSDELNLSVQSALNTNLQEAVKSSEHQMILAAIQTTESRMEAAAKLGISPRTLRYKLAKLKAENGSMTLAA